MISPIYKDKIAIVFSVDNNYINYLSVCLNSLKFHSSRNHFYDIVVLYEQLQEYKINKIISIYEDNNFSIRFFKISEYIKNMRTYLYTCDHFSIANYYRILIPNLLSDYNLAIYCDCDAIFFTDLANIYDIDLGYNLLACVLDIEVQRNHYSKDDYSKNILFYLKNILKLNNPLKYFNSGFLIFNIEKCLKFDFASKSIDILKQIKPRYVDQCIINKVAENKVAFLDLKWNIENHIMSLYDINSLKLLFKDIFNKYLESYKDPYFLHFTGPWKPWSHPYLPYADCWWKYARETPFYEEILF
ncbi:glycosyltransferase family 8 protein, partial [Campylobacter jejuni]|nr:glycosyltransferase family 8 protein [Campylobacter jejuni]